MEGSNGGVLLPLTLRKEVNGVPHGSNKVDHHLNKLLASRLSNPDLTPQEIAVSSKSIAAAAAVAAKAARATADKKAAAAAKAVAAAKSALDLIASFPIHAVAAADYLLLPSELQLGDVIVPNSNKDRCEVPLGLTERPNTEDPFNELVGRGPKEGTRKRGRPKSK